MENFKKALSELGFTSSQLSALENEGADIKDVITGFKEDQKQIFWKNEGKTMLEKEMNEKFIVFQNTTKQKVNKLLGLGKTRSELDPIEFDDFIKEAEGHYKNEVERASKTTDDNLKNELDQLKLKLNEAINKYDNDSSEWQKKLGETEAQWQKRLNSQQVETVFEAATSGLNWHVKEMAPVFKNFIKGELEKNYTINPDGTVLAKDGTVAMSPDGKYVFESITSKEVEKNPILFLAEEHKLFAKNNGADGTPPPPSSNGRFSPPSGQQGFTGRAAEMMARASKK